MGEFINLNKAHSSGLMGNRGCLVSETQVRTYVIHHTPLEGNIHRVVAQLYTTREQIAVSPASRVRPLTRDADLDLEHQRDLWRS
jgi:hypothetical protein